MKRNEISQLHQKPLPELKKMLNETRGKLLKLKMDFLGGKVKDVRSLAKMRDDVARLTTIMQIKELEAEA